MGLGQRRSDGADGVTKRQVEANRRNALLSSGPRTIEGISRSRANSLKHGLSVPIAETDEGASKIDAIQKLLLLDSAQLSLDLAWAMAEHHAELHRIRRARRSPQSQGVINDLDIQKNIQIALSLDRYAKAAFAKRSSAIKADKVKRNLQNEANSSSDELDDTIDVEAS